MKTNTERLPMLCRCSDEGKEEIENVHKEAYELLKEDFLVENFLTEGRPNLRILSFGLEDLGYYVSAIHCDMWFGVTISKYEEDKPDLRMECDDPMDGIAGLYVEVKKRANKKT